jgi:hypothetical protein
MFKWTKLGRIFNPRDFPGRTWLSEFAQAPSSLLFDDFVRVYFSCRPLPDKKGRYTSYSAFVDLDRTNLFSILRLATQPILPLGDVGQFDEFGTYPVSVIRDGKVVWAYYGGWTRCESVPFNVAIGVARSLDGGETFRKLGPGPVLSYSIDEPFVLSGPKIRRFGDLWYLFYIAGRKWKLVEGRPEPVYRIRMATSGDGIAWIKAGRDLIETRLEDDEAQASPDVFECNGLYHMFFCYRRSANFRGRENGYRIGYAVSKDLLNWTRDDAKAGIDVAPEGWDSEMLSYPHVFELDGETYLLYLGNQVGREGFGIARLEGAL